MAKTKACQVKVLLNVLAASKEVAVERQWSGVAGAWLRGQMWIQAFALPFTSEVAVDRSSKPSKPHFPHLLTMMIHKIVQT